MTDPAAETRSVVVERDLAFPPERIWRALTQPHLIEEWLMKTDFKPVMDHRFNFSGDWGAVDCQVLAIEPNKTLSYTWAGMGLESVVTWTLTAYGHGDTSAHGAIGLPAGPGASLPGRHVRVAEVPREPRGGLGACSLKSCRPIQARRAKRAVRSKWSKQS